MKMNISAHVLDTSLGLPAAGLVVTLEGANGESWRTLRCTETDADGRCKSLLPEGAAARQGRYRMRFETGAYFKRKNLSSLYPYVEIVFDVVDARHHHIPLLLTANGYTTYRGS